MWRSSVSAEPLTKSRYGVWSGSTVSEPRFFPVSKKEARAWYQKARTWDRRTKAKRCHGGGIGLPAMKVLEAFHFDFLNFASGRLDPSYAGIALKTGLARSTVAKAIAKLKALGIITWVRRCAHAYVNGVFTLQQRTNAYAILPPSQWLGHVEPDVFCEVRPEDWGATPPLPPLVAQAAAMAGDGASLGTLAGVLDADPGDKLARSLARLAQSMAERAQ